MYFRITAIGSLSANTEEISWFVLAFLEYETGRISKEIALYNTIFSLIILFSRVFFYIFAFKLKSFIMAEIKLNRIKVVLAEKDRTGKWLAGQVGKSNCTVSKWCSNTAQPDLQTLDKIAIALDVNVKDLLNDTEK